MLSNIFFRYRKWVSICVFTLYLCAWQRPVIGLTGQLPDAPSPQSGFSSNIIRISTNLVTLPVSVTDSNGRVVHDLESRDFLIEEDGRSEKISSITQAGQSPLRVALLFDLSGSLHPRFHFEQQAAIRFLQRIWKPGDTLSVIAFAEHPRICLRASDSLSEAFRILWDLVPTEGPTAFFDSVVLSTNILRQSSEPGTRQSVIALSDGEDNRSENELLHVLNAVQRSDAIFYSINPAGSSVRLNEISRQGQADLESLAKETGGKAFVSDKTEDLDDIFERIAAELRAQYLLNYYSTNSKIDGKYRKILVSIPRRPELRIHARRGYYAAKR
ncbi:MAG: VWA domain-containing protein [Acidobacteria bacterium]|nr:VWA domain-containing protein [Acidobacteriota bacterium]